jgi:hypothetical protein
MYSAGIAFSSILVMFMGHNWHDLFVDREQRAEWLERLAPISATAPKAAFFGEGGWPWVSECPRGKRPQGRA